VGWSDTGVTKGHAKLKTEAGIPNIDGPCTRNAALTERKNMTRLESVISFRVSAIVVAACLVAVVYCCCWWLLLW